MNHTLPYAIMGVTGQVGGAVARALQNAQLPVRAILRDPRKAPGWAARGEIAIADATDRDSLAQSFRGAAAVFILFPPIFDPAPGFPEARALAANLVSALEEARPGRVVYLSTIGAQASQENLLTQHSIVEKALAQVTLPITFLRPAWFMENCAWDVASARETGVIPSFLQPLDHPIPMVATEDIGRVAAELLQEDWTGHRIVELEGPQRVTPRDIAAAFAKTLGRPMRMETVSRDTWQDLFLGQGMKNPVPRVRMIDGFNEGWIEFETGSAVRQGNVNLQTVISRLVQAKP